MTIGQRIKKARLHRGLTQRQLGMLVGFPENSADARIAQYEASDRKPRTQIKYKLSEVLGINPRYFFMHENFIFEDIFLTLLELDEGCKIDLTPVCGRSRTRVTIHFDYEEMDDFLLDWIEQKQALAENKITKKDYMDWVLTYSALTQH